MSEEAIIRKKACLVIYNDQKQLLIQDRSSFSKPGEYGWFGGKLKQGETVEQALKREIKEELELDISGHTFLMKYNLLFPQITDIISLFIIKLPNQKITCHEGEIVWVTVEEARKLLMPQEAALLGKIKEWLDKNA